MEWNSEKFDKLTEIIYRSFSHNKVDEWKKFKKENQVRAGTPKAIEVYDNPRFDIPLSFNYIAYLFPHHDKENNVVIIRNPFYCTTTPPPFIKLSIIADDFEFLEIDEERARKLLLLGSFR